MGRFTGLQADKLDMPDRKTKRTNKLTGPAYGQVKYAGQKDKKNKQN